MRTIFMISIKYGEIVQTACRNIESGGSLKLFAFKWFIP